MSAHRGAQFRVAVTIKCILRDFFLSFLFFLKRRLPKINPERLIILTLMIVVMNQVARGFLFLVS